MARMVHHDDALGRLTEGSGALLQKTAAELKAVKFRDTGEHMIHPQHNPKSAIISR